MGTTSEKLTYLSTTKTLIKEELNLGGANITNEPFRAYKGKLEGIYKDFLANGTDTLWNNWEKVSGSGTEISLNNTIEAPMRLVYKGDTQQNGTPTPDTPINVNVVSGDNTIDICGKNLLPVTNQDLTINGVSFKAQNGKIIINGTATSNISGAYLKNDNSFPITLKAGTYYFKRTSNDISTGLIDDNNNTIVVLPSGADTYEQSFTLSSDKKLYLYFFIASGRTITNYEYELMISNTATPYTPYVSQSYPISLGNIELCKIGTYQDKIFKNTPNTTDYNSNLEDNVWYLKKEIGKVVLNDSENWSLQSINSYGIANFQRFISDYIGSVINNSYNNYFSPQTTGIADTQNEGYYLGGNKYLSIRIKSDTASTVNDFKTWLSTHNAILYFSQATPTYEEITDATLISQLEAIKSLNEQTNISQENNDLPFELDVVALKEV